MISRRLSTALLGLLMLVACASPRDVPRPAAAVPNVVTAAWAPLHEPLDGAGERVPTATAVVAPIPEPNPAAVAAAAAAGPHGRIQVPSLGIDLPIVEGDGLEPPLYAAAHYPGMKWPGEGDRTFLYAHARPGMFAGLFRAAVGQKVVISLPSGRVINYTIRSYTASWPVTDLSILSPVGHEQVVLYTCTSWTYSDPKIVAIAEPDAS